jgi:hypothetical protein
MSILTAIAAFSASIVPATVAGFSASGSPGVVSRDGGSIVRMESISRTLVRRSFVDCCGAGMLRKEMARRVSATETSSFVGSNKRLSPTATTSKVIEGRSEALDALELRGYNDTAASQSSLNSGSSSSSDFSAGSFVFKSARCVVRDSNGIGYESGGEIRSIYDTVRECSD